MKNKIIPVENIQNMIFTIRGMQVMIDSDLAKLYGVETKNLNRAVNRNIERFPERYRFQLTKEEFNNLRFQSGTSTEHGGRRYMPYVFTEQGVSMLSAVLRSKTAIKVSIQIVDAFVEMRHFIVNNAGIFQRLDKIERKQIETDDKFEQIFKALGDQDQSPNQGIFFNGQIFDAYSFVADLIRSAKRSIILIDNYIDDTVLTLLGKRNKDVEAVIFTKNINKQLALDIEKFNAQYEPVKVKIFKDAHDRFLILDHKEIYHFGASLKDLGKKWFAFSKMDKNSVTILNSISKIL